MDFHRLNHELRVLAEFVGVDVPQRARPSGLEVLVVENLTCRVRPTWDVLIGRVENPWLAPLRWLVGREIRRFAAGFSTIAEAYDSGAMRYGLLVAARP